MFGEYKTLVVKMRDDSTSNIDARNNYELLCDVEIVMGLTCVLLMLEAVQSLNKLIQNKNIFIFILLWLSNHVKLISTPCMWILRSNTLVISSKALWIW
jgi:hypothetical protein